MTVCLSWVSVLASVVVGFGGGSLSLQHSNLPALMPEVTSSDEFEAMLLADRARAATYS